MSNVELMLEEQKQTNKLLEGVLEQVQGLREETKNLSIETSKLVGLSRRGLEKRRSLLPKSMAKSKSL